jgi:hypothetical protein
MNDKITLVTPPDDILEDGLRILLVGLIPEQSNVVSDALAKVNDIPNTIVYMADDVKSDELEWVLDKKLKSCIIIFNADMGNQYLAGYLASQRNAYYFGSLKGLELINKKAIYSVEQLIALLEENAIT